MANRGTRKTGPKGRDWERAARSAATVIKEQSEHWDAERRLMLDPNAALWWAVVEQSLVDCAKIRHVVAKKSHHPVAKKSIQAHDAADYLLDAERSDGVFEAIGVDPSWARRVCRAFIEVIEENVDVELRSSTRRGN